MVRYSPSPFSLEESRIYVNLGKFSKTGLEHIATTIFDCEYILFRNASFKLMQWDADLAKSSILVLSFHEIFSAELAVIIKWNSPMDVIFVQSPSFC